MVFIPQAKRSDLICSDQTRSGRERVQVGRARAGKIGDRKQSDSYTDLYACAPLCVSVTTKNGGRSLDVLRASRRLIATPNCLFVRCFFHIYLE